MYRNDVESQDPRGKIEGGGEIKRPSRIRARRRHRSVLKIHFIVHKESIECNP